MFLATLLEVIKYTLPALVVFATVYFVIRELMKQELNKQALAYKKDVKAVTINLRLQAYERMAVFCERIRLTTTALRVGDEKMSAKEMGYSLIGSIQQEYDYNVAQQVYVSPQLWAVIKTAKENTIGTINKLIEQMPESANAQDLLRLLYAHNAVSDRSLDVALQGIQQEASDLM